MKKGRKSRSLGRKSKTWIGDVKYDDETSEFHKDEVEWGTGSEVLRDLNLW